MEVPCILLEVAPAGQGISTIGGGPRLSPGMTVPTCRACSGPMSLFLQLELAGGVPAHVPTGNRLLVFACVGRDDLPTSVGAEALPAEYWTLDTHHRLFLAPSGTAAMYARDRRIDERSLIARNARDTGIPGLKIGGVPTWAAPEPHTCVCGAPMRFVAQIPGGFEFPLKDSDQPAHLFGGAEIYLFSCEKACDPRAVWAVVAR
jgi:hypothetical protein